MLYCQMLLDETHACSIQDDKDPMRRNGQSCCSCTRRLARDCWLMVAHSDSISGGTSLAFTRAVTVIFVNKRFFSLVSSSLISFLWHRSKTLKKCDEVWSYACNSSRKLVVYVYMSKWERRGRWRPGHVHNLQMSSVAINLIATAVSALSLLFLFSWQWPPPNAVGGSTESICMGYNSAIES